MASYIRAARLRALLAGNTSPSAPPAPLVFHEPFTDAEWRVSRLARELVDSVVHTHRWRVTVLLSADRHTPRRFYLRGTLAGVTARARTLFPAESYSILVEPAPVQVGGEAFDRRLSVL